jgi:hypothetical protein
MKATVMTQISIQIDLSVDTCLFASLLAVKANLVLQFINSAPYNPNYYRQL